MSLLELYSRNKRIQLNQVIKIQKMKALFLIFHGFQEANGISKKIQYQVHALEANGMETHLCYLSDEYRIKRRMIDQDVLVNYGT